jgi:hypothetical protein
MSAVAGVITYSLAFLAGPYPHAAPGVTSLTRVELAYITPIEHFIVLQRGDVTAIVVDNHAVDVPDLPGHRAGYNGIVKLSAHRRRCHQAKQAGP